MGKTCYGCMKEKTSSPVCEHCGFDERQRNERHQLPIGIVLRQQYVVGRVLGQGGFGITYIGWDMNLDMPVAIKEFYPGSMVSRDCTIQTEIHCYTNARAAYEDSKNRFLREAKALARFREVPEIVHVQNFFEENGTAYIVMEYVQGTDLRNYLRSAAVRPTVQEVLEILRPVLQALATVHQAGLVHRDISPDNIMLLPNGKVKLLDFGAVREVGNAAVDKELTHATQAILKHGFAPLEQYQAKGALGPWTDIYALCATIYYCATGKVPPEAHERMMEDIPIAWSSVPGLTGQQTDTLEKGMALMPRDRIGSAQELYEGLYGTPKAVPREKTETPAAEEKIPVQQAPEKEVREISSGGSVQKKSLLTVGILLVLAVAAKLALANAQFSYTSSDLYDFLMGSALIAFRFISVLLPIFVFFLRKRRKPGQYVWVAGIILAYSMLIWVLDDVTGYLGRLYYYSPWKCYYNLIPVNVCMLALNILDMETEKSRSMRIVTGLVSVVVFGWIAVEYILLSSAGSFAYYPHPGTIPAVLALNFPFLIIHLIQNTGTEIKTVLVSKLMKFYPAVLLVMSVVSAVIIEKVIPAYLR